MVYESGECIAETPLTVIPSDTHPELSHTTPANSTSSCLSTSSRLLSTRDYLSLPRAPETWLIEPLLPTGGSLLLYGDPKVGKSFAALQLASNLAVGEDFLGFHIPAAKKVAYIQLDTPRTLWASRVEALTSSLYGITRLLLGDRETLDTWPFDILNPSHEHLLADVLGAAHVDCVILDTLRECHSGDENDSTAMQAVIAHLTAAVKPAALILVAHSRKSNPENGYDLMNDNRGSNYIVGRMDAIARMSHTTIRVSGRAIDEQSIQLERQDNGLWGLAHDPLTEKASSILAIDGLSVREMAKLLHEAFPGRSETACRAYLRRRMKPGSA